MTNSGIEIHKGLNGVYFDKSDSCFIDGGIGKLLYRGYNIHDLAEKSTFEEVVYLLLYGTLPTIPELSDFDKQLRSNRELPQGVLDVIETVKNAHPMDVLRTAVSALSAFDDEVDDNDDDADFDDIGQNDDDVDDYNYAFDVHDHDYHVDVSNYDVLMIIG